MNLTRWASLRDAKTPPDAMDWRHVQMIHAVLHHEAPRSIVEIGCARGFSTSAIMEAVELSSGIRTVDLVDPYPQIDLVNAVLSVHPAHVFATFKVHAIPSRHYTGTPECWLIDGDHNADALIDYQKARACGARIITVHDSNSAHVIGNHKGSLEIGERLKAEATWHFEDKVKRDGEFTERGLIVGIFGEVKAETVKALEALST